MNAAPDSHHPLFLGECGDSSELAREFGSMLSIMVTALAELFPRTAENSAEIAPAWMAA